MAGAAFEFTDINFESEVLKSDLPVFVDFWGEGCAPCAAIEPVIEELASEYKDRVKFGKLDVYTNPNISTRYGIRSLPSLLIFKDGEVHDTIIGARPKIYLREKVDEAL